MVTKVVFLKSAAAIKTKDETTYPVDPTYRANEEGTEAINYRTAWDGPDPSRYEFLIYNVGDVVDLEDALATAWIAAGICKAST